MVHTYIMYLPQFIKERPVRKPDCDKSIKQSKYSELCIEEQKSVDMACMAKSEELANLCPIFKGLLQDCMKFRNQKYTDKNG